MSPEKEKEDVLVEGFGVGAEDRLATEIRFGVERIHRLLQVCGWGNSAGDATHRA